MTKKDTRFKKGQSGNPAGPKPLPEDIREANKLTKTMIMEILGQYLSMRVESLNHILTDDTKPVFHRMVASVAKIAIEQGDHQRLNFFMDRIVGKVTDRVEHKGATPVLISYSNGEQTLLTTTKDED
jgi:hypothetical protein